MKILLFFFCAAAEEHYLPPTEHYQQLSIMPNITDAEAAMTCTGV